MKSPEQIAEQPDNSLPISKIKYRQFLESRFWYDLRESAIKQAGSRCQVCSIRGVVLQAHHIRYPSDWYKTTLADLKVVCRQCHRREHGIWQRDAWKRKLKKRLTRKQRNELKRKLGPFVFHPQRKPKFVSLYRPSGTSRFSEPDVSPISETVNQVAGSDPAKSMPSIGGNADTSHGNKSSTPLVDSSDGLPAADSQGWKAVDSAPARTNIKPVKNPPPLGSDPFGPAGALSRRRLESNTEPVSS